jgi:DNA-binding cell septation regulator SpoVG
MRVTITPMHRDLFSVEVKFDEHGRSITLHGCKIFSHGGRRYVSFPSVRLKDGSYRNHVTCSNELHRMVIAEYDRSIENSKEG